MVNYYNVAHGGALGLVFGALVSIALEWKQIKPNFLARTDQLSLWAFLRCLRYWKWRTGKPAIVMFTNTDEAQAMWNSKERVH